ncbi:MAG: hypothetical protein V9G19_13925 [Tetrasphaera sp.]
MLPMKTRILEYGIQKDAGFDADEMMSALAPQYGTEKMCSRKQVEEYLDSFLGVGFMKAENLELDQSGNLHVTYVVTDYGKSRQKYL